VDCILSRTGSNTEKSALFFVPLSILSLSEPTIMAANIFTTTKIRTDQASWRALTLFFWLPFISGGHSICSFFYLGSSRRIFIGIKYPLLHHFVRSES